MTEDVLPDLVPIELSVLPPDEAITALVFHADSLHASDLFFLSDERGMTIRARQWGIVRTLATLEPEEGRRYISSIKALADMDIAERRRPLDGRAMQRRGDQVIDLRISTIPTMFGEDVALRLLSRESQQRSLDQLGMEPHELGRLKAMLSSPSGLILFTGPTGTGKTTSLYACVEHLNDGRRKINTLEDPVEYAIQGVRQSQVNPRLGVDFPHLLRSILRQAPDVIMVGEIRDAETAVTAVRAANSGHLVFATLHAPVAAGAVQSLLALGVHPHFLASCLLGIIAQRLVRTLCPECRAEYDLSDSPHTFADIEPLLAPGEGRAFYGPGSCDQCYRSGYRGQTGVFEVMSFNPALRRLVAEVRPAREIERHAVAAGMVEFRRAAMLKVARGLTSTEEVLRVVPSDHLGLEDDDIPV